MKPIGLVAEWRRDAQGATVVEFAIVFPIFAMLMIGGIFGCALLYSNMSLQASVERAARCYSVNATTCSTTSGVQTYALSQYAGISTPEYTASMQSCGHEVVGSTSISFPTPTGRVSVPLSARSCFP